MRRLNRNRDNHKTYFDERRLAAASPDQRQPEVYGRRGIIDARRNRRHADRARRERQKELVPKEHTVSNIGTFP
eukprot:6182577-Pleurochrysis_carterae.AAC.1